MSHKASCVSTHMMEAHRTRIPSQRIAWVQQSPLDGQRLGHSPSHHLPPGARQRSGRQPALQPLSKDKLGNGKGRERGMRASKAPPRDAAGTGHLCSTANNADSGMQSPRKRGLQHILAPAGRCFPVPSAQQAAKLGLNTCPTTGATAGQGLLA